MAWHLSPASHGRSALVPKKRLLSSPLSNLALGWFKSHQPLWRLLCNRPLKMSSVRGDLQSPVAAVFSTYRPGNRGIRIRVHRWLRSSGRPAIPPGISSISAHGAGAGRMLRLALSSTVVCFRNSVFGPNGLPPPWCAPPKTKLVLWGPAAAAAAAAAKSLQSCPTLCDGSPPGSPAPGIL